MSLYIKYNFENRDYYVELSEFSLFEYLTMNSKFDGKEVNAYTTENQTKNIDVSTVALAGLGSFLAALTRLIDNTFFGEYFLVILIISVAMTTFGMFLKSLSNNGKRLKEEIKLGVIKKAKIKIKIKNKIYYFFMTFLTYIFIFLFALMSYHFYGGGSYFMSLMTANLVVFLISVGFIDIFNYLRWPHKYIEYFEVDIEGEETLKLI
jgi:hypothetical protein